jgi:hypothetical protein
MTADPQAERLGEFVRAFLTMVALVYAVRYVTIPMVIAWVAEYRQKRAERLQLRLDNTPPDPSTTRHGAS